MYEKPFYFFTIWISAFTSLITSLPGVVVPSHNPEKTSGQSLHKANNVRSLSALEKLERQFMKSLSHHKLPGSTTGLPVQRWAVIQLMISYKIELVRDVCQEASNILNESTANSPVDVLAWSHELSNAKLVIAGIPSAEIDVLTCKILDKPRVHTTKGRHRNSVYFVKPEKLEENSNHFILDEKFNSDIELQTITEQLELFQKSMTNLKTSRKP